MILDLADADGDPFAGRTFDVCICGAGVVGITLALRLSRSLNVLLLEGGGFDNSVETQDVYAGQSVGQEYFDLRATRLRYFGGSSNHWGGDCRPMDAADFEPKPYLDLSGWPICRRDLDPYLQQAEAILDLDQGDNWDAPNGYFEDRINSSPAFHSIKYRFSPPTRFGNKYRKEVATRGNVFCLLNANVVELRLQENRARLQHMLVRGYEGQTFEARARTFVLAAGGMENPRLLLNSDRQVSGGIGNDHDQVGRYFTDHLFTKLADVTLEDEAKSFVEQYPFGRTFEGRLKSSICFNDWLHDATESVSGKELDCLSEVKHYFSPTGELMQKERILNASIRLRVRAPGHEEVTDGKIFIGAEQALNPRSRISLADELDQLGMRRIRLDWQLSDIDLRTLRTIALRFGEMLARQSIGRLHMVDWLTDDDGGYFGTGGHHHMCTTRMGESPANAVVDRDLRVFDIENLYVAGSSVFATGGYANPTLTIVQLTLRLAEHLNNRG